MEKIVLGNDFVNFIFLGSLVLLVISRLILRSNAKALFGFSSMDMENGNFSLYIVICGLIYNFLLSLLLLPFFNKVFAFYNSEWLRYLILFTAIFIYQLFTYSAGNIFLRILGKEDREKNNYLYRFVFLFIKLFAAILLCIVVYYTPFKGQYLLHIVIVTTCLLWVCEWIWLMFFIKSNIKVPNYYEFLYLCTFEILPALCLLKWVFFE